MEMSESMALGILTGVTELADKVVNGFDEGKYASSAITMYGSDPNNKTLDALINLVENASDLSTQEKYDRLLALNNLESELREREFDYKYKCARSIDEGFERKGKFVLKLVFGALSGGLSLIPDGYHFIKGDTDDNFFSDLIKR